VPNIEIVSGYEYTKGQYVVVDPAELDLLRTEADKAISVSAFVAPDAIDEIYYDERTYYLVPDGPVGQRPYAVLLEAMIEENRYAVAQVVLHGREHLVLLRPMDRLLAMTKLKYDAEVTKPQAFEYQAPEVKLSDEELELTKRVIELSTPKKFDFSAYRDVYTEKLTKLLEAKVAGEEIVAPPSQEPAQIVNLMDALRASVANAEQAASAEDKPEKKMAPSKGKEPEPGSGRVLEGPFAGSGGRWPRQRGGQAARGFPTPPDRTIRAVARLPHRSTTPGTVPLQSS
jgi:DNA end-binding protein Ku